MGWRKVFVGWVVCLLVSLLVTGCGDTGSEQIANEADETVPTLAAGPESLVDNLTATAVPTPIPTPTLSIPPTRPADPNLPDWTLLIYMAGDNAFDAAAFADFNEMELAGDSPQVNILVQYDRPPASTAPDAGWSETRRYRVRGDSDSNAIQSELLASLGEQNMGDPVVLADFVSWGMLNYPANRYGLLIWDHAGSGFGLATDTDAPEWGQDELSLADLNGGLQSGLAAAGLPILDLIAFDVPRSVSLTQLIAIQPYARYAVGVPLLQPQPGWDYERLLGHLFANSQMDGAELATQMVLDYRTQYTQTMDDPFAALTAVDLTRLPQLFFRIEQLTTRIQTNPQVLAAARTAARAAQTTLPPIPAGLLNTQNSLNFNRFLMQAAAAAPEAETAVFTAAAESAEQVVIAQHVGDGLPEGIGLTLELPLGTGMPDTAPQLFLNIKSVGPVGPGMPALLGYQITGLEMPPGALFVAVEEAEQRRLLTAALPRISDAGQSGVAEGIGIWQPAGAYLQDDAGEGRFVVTWPDEGDRGYTAVRGQYRPRDDAPLQPALLLIGSDDDAQRLYLLTDGTPAHVRVSPEADFLPDDYVLSSTGALESSPGGTVLRFGENGRLTLTREPLPAGDYVLTLYAAGSTTVPTLPISVETGPLPAEPVFLDPARGFQFRYPTGWPAPAFTGSLLTTGAAQGTVALQVTLLPGIPAEQTPQLILEEALARFGAVDILFTDEAVIGDTAVPRRAYSYVDPDGERHTGVVFALRHDGVGYVVDLDGLTAEETAVLEAAALIAESWTFRQLDPALPPGRWERLSFAAFEIYQPGSFLYQQLESWHWFGRDAETFLALRLLPAGSDAAATAVLLAGEAGRDVAEFTRGEAAPFYLADQVWQRVDFQYVDDEAGDMHGAVLVRAVGEMVTAVWFEAPSAAMIDGVESDFLTMLVSLSLR